MKLFLYSLTALLCITCVFSSISPDHSVDAPPVLVKFSKSFYQSHSLDIDKAIDTTISPNNIAIDDSSQEVSNEGMFSDSSF